MKTLAIMTADRAGEFLGAVCGEPERAPAAAEWIRELNGRRYEYLPFADYDKNFFDVSWESGDLYAVVAHRGNWPGFGDHG